MRILVIYIVMLVSVSCVTFGYASTVNDSAETDKALSAWISSAVQTLLTKQSEENGTYFTDTGFEEYRKHIEADKRLQSSGKDEGRISVKQRCSPYLYHDTWSEVDGLYASLPLDIKNQGPRGFSRAQKMLNLRIEKSAQNNEEDFKISGWEMASDTKFLNCKRFEDQMHAHIEMLKNKATMIDIEVALPIKFDFKTKDEILELRKQQVAKYPELLKKEYEPSFHVFGEIEDGLPWIGIKGQLNGPGEQIIEGLSSQSLFVMNPFLLVGLEGYSGWRTAEGLQFQYLKPQSLMWHKTEDKAFARYDLRSFLSTTKTPHKAIDRISLIAYNARDFGYNYMYFDPENSSNVTLTDKPFRIRHFIHKGGSCGHPNQCNNVSPYQAEMEIDVFGIPAKAHVKLWKEEPESPTADPDMTFVIDMQ